MNLLIDTHVAIWSLTQSTKLPNSVRGLLSHASNQIYVSSVSIWEISIKHSLRNVSAPPFSGRQALAHLHEIGCKVLAVNEIHAAAVDDLPLLHGDPFDRLLIAQALSEPMRLVSGDRQLAAYSNTVITW